MTGISGAIFWIILALLFFIIESVTVQFVCIWFAIGSIVAMLSSFFGAPFIAQLIIFLITSIAVLIVFRPFLKNRLTPKKTATNADAVIGQTGIVIEEIDNALQTGRVSVSGLDWTARSESGGIIAVREGVVVKRIDGVKLIVDALKAPEGE